MHSPSKADTKRGITFSRLEPVAVEKGYRVEGLSVVGPSGKTLKLQINKGGYPSFSIKARGKSGKLTVHRLAAFQKFGDRIYTEGLEVRHLDGNRLDFAADNLELGTPSQNAMDKLPEVRCRVSSESNRKYDANAVCAFHSVSKSYRLTMAHFGISSKGTLGAILRKSRITSTP